ncbi:MAG: hypothetical protein AAFQ32_04515 [Pseudomonadota bacterium]
MDIQCFPVAALAQTAKDQGWVATIVDDGERLMLFSPSTDFFSLWEQVGHLLCFAGYLT